jgi:hypothetical protein
VAVIGGPLISTQDVDPTKVLNSRSPPVEVSGAGWFQPTRATDDVARPVRCR